MSSRSPTLPDLAAALLLAASLVPAAALASTPAPASSSAAAPRPHATSSANATLSSRRASSGSAAPSSSAVPPPRTPSSASAAASSRAAASADAAAFAPVSGSAVAPLPINAELSAAGKTTLVVDLGAAPLGTKRTVALNLDGVPGKADLTPVTSDDLALSMVVDASAQGSSSLPNWLSAGARFSLAAPAGTRAVVIADRKPATRVAAPVRGPLGVVRALDTIRASGERDTAAALTLAAKQFPGTEAGHRVTLLYTSAAGVNGLTATQLADRFRSAGILLVVVGTSDPDRYWSSATAATGGFFAPAGSPVVVSALDQVETTLSGRYLVRFTTPPTLPARASVSIRAGDVTLSAETLLGPPLAAPTTPRTWLAAALTNSALVVIIAVVALSSLIRRRRRAPKVPPSSPYAVLLGGPALPQALSPAAPPTEPRPRVRMRPPPRGQATVPGSPQPPPPALGPGWP